MPNMQANNKKSKEQIKKNKQKILCISPTQCSEKGLMKLCAVYAKRFKTLKCLRKNFFKIHVMNLCLMPCFCITFKS